MAEQKPETEKPEKPDGEGEGDIVDVVIIGGGPAGYTAALYTARNRLTHVQFEGANAGGQLMKTTYVENYPGVGKINGYDLVLGMDLESQQEAIRDEDNHCVTGQIRGKTDAAKELVKPIVTGLRGDALREGARIMPYNVTGVDLKKDAKSGLFTICYEDYDINKTLNVRAKSIIIATGASPRVLEMPTNEARSQKFFNLLTCAVCDGRLPHFKNKPLAVVGGGDAAMEDALFLVRTSNPVYIIHRSENFRASPVMLQRARSTPGIVFLTHTIVTDVNYLQEDKENTANKDKEKEKEKEEKKEEKKNRQINAFNKLYVKNLVSQDTKVLDVAGLFFAIGHKPCTDLFKGHLTLNSDGYIAINPGTDTETSIPGVHAAGDCQDFKYRQAIRAASSGCEAALNVNRWLLEHAD